MIDTNNKDIKILTLNPCNIFCPSQSKDLPNGTTKRFRKDYGDIEGLANSIEKRGQIQPIVVTKQDNGYLLVAGERRLRACIFKQLSINAVLREELTDFEAKMLELEENVKRKDIDWEEQCEALRQLHELLLNEKGHSYKSEEEGWNLQKTANFIGLSVGTVSQDVSLADNLNKYPDLRKKVKKLNKASARKLVKQTLSAKILETSMKDKGVSTTFNLKNVACEIGIKDLGSESVHCLITDPPFAVDNISNAAHKQRSSVKDSFNPSYNDTNSNVSTEEELKNIYMKLIPELYRVLVEGAHFYMFLGFGWYCRLVAQLRSAGFVVDDQPIIWYKERRSILSRGAHYMSSYEACLFGHKPPQKRILLHPKANMLSVKAIAGQKRVHPLQKPFELLQIFIENSTSPGETVLDCFAGSGATLLAAQKLHRESIGFELDRGNYLRALEWFDKEKI